MQDTVRSERNHIIIVIIYRQYLNLTQFIIAKYRIVEQPWWKPIELLDFTHRKMITTDTPQSRCGGRRVKLLPQT